MNWSIGIDIGGTTIKAVAAQKDGTILHRNSEPTKDQSNSLTPRVIQAQQISILYQHH